MKDNKIQLSYPVKHAPENGAIIIIILRPFGINKKMQPIFALLFCGENLIGQFI